MSNFAFLAAEFPEIFESSKRAESYATSDLHTDTNATVTTS
jgi:hypothetical protein